MLRSNSNLLETDPDEELEYAERKGQCPYARFPLFLLNLGAWSGNIVESNAKERRESG